MLRDEAPLSADRRSCGQAVRVPAQCARCGRDLPPNVGLGSYTVPRDARELCSWCLTGHGPEWLGQPDSLPPTELDWLGRRLAGGRVESAVASAVVALFAAAIAVAFSLPLKVPLWVTVVTAGGISLCVFIGLLRAGSTARAELGHPRS